ncbi:hypothetical protein DFA_09429 [Cavenderia fasciculata]|uniref:histidine kinase n=1 Tax=Cavenderia fasciculata TaxID=261658 RepID=F4Q7L3_CACFS|nr:uncharacterized protein DFA_09429 [Cavenderia fasciculata]EGG16395.1 hypothetical protein DFA_09429 [Cavenderia fasciculata]|eukprot:XP_004354779.1 hypothetical protein DFA_09429 [Cavenderia fasciculata]
MSSTNQNNEENDDDIDNDTLISDVDFYNDQEEQQQQQQQILYQQQLELKNNDENMNVQQELEYLRFVVESLTNRIQQMESNIDQNAVTFPHLQQGQSLDQFSETVAKVIADASPFLLWMSGVDGKAIYFNKKWYEFTGRSVEEELGDGWTEIVHREDLVRIFSIYMEAFHNRTSFKLEYRAMRHDGVYRWLIDTGCPRFSPDQKFLGYVGSCLDVTDMWHSKHETITVKKQLESLLKCSEYLLNNPGSSSSTSSSSSFSNANRLIFFKSILKSLTYSFLSNGSIIFLVDSNNPCLLRIGQKHNVNIDQDYTIQLPERFWQQCIETMQPQTPEQQLHQKQQDSIHHAAAADPPIDPVQMERRDFYEDIPSSPLEQYPLSEMFKRIDQANNMVYLQPNIYSMLYQNYISPLMIRLGMKSVTTEFIPHFGNYDSSIPYGFITIGTVAQRQFSAIEQNTLKVMSNIASGFVYRQTIQAESLSKSLILDELKVKEEKSIILTNHNGFILESFNQDNNIIGMDILEVFSKLGDLKQSSFIKSFPQFIKTLNIQQIVEQVGDGLIDIKELPNQTFLFLFNQYNNQQQQQQMTGIENNNNNNCRNIYHQEPSYRWYLGCSGSASHQTQGFMMTSVTSSLKPTSSYKTKNKVISVYNLLKKNL